MAETDAEVLQALDSVQDPELGLSIVELGMVSAARSKRRRLEVTLALPAPGYSSKQELTDRVRQALSPLGGTRDLELTLVGMSDDATHALRQRLGAARAEAIAGSAGPNSPLGHEEGRPNVFMSPGSPTRVLGVSSGKGGVGKSSVTVNLSVALARLGRQVAVLDADVYGFSVPKMLGVGSPMIIEDLVVPPRAHGVRCMSIGYFIEESQPVIWRGPMLHKALEQFLVDVWWGDPEWLIVDMPPGTGDVALSMAEYLPRSEVVVVTTPQPAAQRVAQRSAYAARRLKLPVRGVVENMSWFTADDGKRYEIFGAGGGESLAESLGVPLLGRVPLVTALREGGDEGLPVTVADPSNEASLAFEELARAVDSMSPARLYRPELTVR